jgi:hypothetical protein
MLVEHALEDLVIAAVEFILAFLGQELHAAEPGDLLEVEVLGDQTTAQMKSTDEAKGALAGASASHQDDGCVWVEKALIWRGGRQGIFDGHDGASGIPT